MTMSKIGQIERLTQNRIIGLFCDTLKYEYLGNWEDRSENRDIEEGLLREFLSRFYDEGLISKALFELNKVAGDQNRSLYDINKDVYTLLRYGVKVKPEAGENTETIWLIDWADPLNNHFAIAEEVTVSGKNTKRPDVVIYVNGIALGVLELKRSIVSVGEGIRQNLDNQKKEFIQPFFTTMQFVMAGNDTESLRYGTIETRERNYMAWKEPSDVQNLLDRALLQLCEKTPLLEIIHNFTVFDAGTKKLCRPQPILWRQSCPRTASVTARAASSGTRRAVAKSLTMVWPCQNG